MANLGTVYVGVKLDRQAAQASVKETGNVMASGLESQMGGESGRKIGRSLGASIAKGFAAGAAVGGIAEIFRTGFSESSDYQKGLAQLQAGLKSTGGAAGITAKQMEGLASSIQGYS